MPAASPAKKPAKNSYIKATTVITLICFCLLASSCLGRLSLETYLRNLDDIRSQADTAFTSIKTSMENISNGPNAANILYGQVSSAQKVLQKCKSEIQKIKPPDKAQSLHAIMLALFGEAAGFFTDLKSMMEYTSKRAPLISRFEDASRELDSRIAADPKTASVALALADASVKADVVKSELIKLSPPAFLKGPHGALLEMIGNYSSSLLELKSAVESSNAAGISAAQDKIRTALSGNLAEATSKSMEDYNARIDSIEKLREEANSEETRITGGQ